MVLWRTFQLDTLLCDFANELESDWVHRELQQCYRGADPSVPNQYNEIENNDEKFAVELGMLHIEPERMHIEEQKLTTDGQQKEKADSDFMKRALVLCKWEFPEDCDSNNICSPFVGHL